MTSRIVEHAGVSYEVSTDSLSNGKFICRVVSRGLTGRYLRNALESPVDSDDAILNPLIQFESEQSALDAGEQSVREWTA